MIEQTKVPYGYCPKCGAPGQQRERRPNGNDICKKGCTYPSRDSLPEPNSEIEDEDAFTAESNEEVLEWVKR